MVVLTYCYHYLYPYSSYHYYHYWFYYFIIIIITKFYCYFSHHYYCSQYYQCYLYHFILFYFLLFILPWLLSVCCVWRVCVLSYIFFPFLVNDLYFIIALLMHVKNHFSFGIIVYIIIVIITIILFFSALPVIVGEFSKLIQDGLPLPIDYFG